MSLFDIILLAIALAMDCFTISIVCGIISNSQSTTLNEAVENDYVLCIMNYALLRMAFLFGLFQALMPLLGWLGISHFQSYM
jgi:putative Mn2+ efflux pump MntP